MNLLTLKAIRVKLNSSLEITNIEYDSTDKSGKFTTRQVNVKDYKLLVNQNGNHNKFYELYSGEHANGERITIAKYGRIGRNPVQYLYYDYGAFDKKYREKLSKGYREVSVSDYRKDYRNI